MKSAHPLRNATPRLAVLLALCCLAQSRAHAANEAPITSVVLYPGSATIMRSAAVKPGMTQLEIKGVPANFDAQTMRVLASTGIQVGQIVTRDAGKVESANAREADLEARIQALNDSKDVLNVDARSAALVQGYLEHLNGAGAAGGDKAQPYIDAKSMAGVIDTVRRGARDSFAQIQRTETQVREIDKKIEALQRDLDRVRGGARDLRDITISLAVRQAGTVQLSYQVNGAGWKPTYRASLDSGASTIELERLASISQKTGEDWSGVALKLSTGQPRLSPQAPDPMPRLLNYVKPQPKQAMVRQNGMAIQPIAPAPMAMARRSAESSEEAYIPPVIEQQENFTTEFDVPTRVSLPADGREISVALAKVSLPAQQQIRVVPRIDKTAVVVAEASRPDGVWLNGDMQLFRDGNYVGATHWNTEGADRLVFPFGRDDLLRVSVDRAKQQGATVGLLSQRAEREVADLYTISSFHPAPVRLLVLEQSPVGTSDEIKVRASYAPQPTIENWNQRQGVQGWEQTIAPRETLKFNVQYVIDYPKEGTVTGLP